MTKQAKDKNQPKAAVHKARAVEIDAHLLKALDYQVVTFGLGDRTALVNHVLSAWLRRGSAGRLHALLTEEAIDR